jgi:hypothetical protein
MCKVRDKENRLFNIVATIGVSSLLAALTLGVVWVAAKFVVVFPLFTFGLLFGGFIAWLS